jgi:hypothetical protein
MERSAASFESRGLKSSIEYREFMTEHDSAGGSGLGFAEACEHDIDLL